MFLVCLYMPYEGYDADAAVLFNTEVQARAYALQMQVALPKSRNDCTWEVISLAKPID